MRNTVLGMLVGLSSAVAGTEDANAASSLLIEHGDVLTMVEGQPLLKDTDILVRDGRIIAIGHDLSAEGAQRIDARDKVVMPGLVDAHTHLWITTMRGQFRNADGKFFPVSSKLGAEMTAEDTYLAMRLGAAELIDAGITTTGDFFDNIKSPAYAAAGLRALDDSGIRAVMYYGGADKTTRTPIDVDDLQRKLAERGNDPSSQRVRLGLAWRLPRDLDDARNWQMRQHEYEVAQKLGLPLQVHVSGNPGPMFDALIQRHYLAPNVTVVHATDASPAQLQALERAGGGLALTPISEQRVGYGLTRVDHFSSISRRGLGVDGNSLSGSADMFEIMRLTALTWSGQTRDETAPDPHVLLAMATRKGADAIGLGKVTGSLAAGKRADIILIDPTSLNMSGFGGGDPAAWLMYSARPANVDTVIVDGRVLKRNGQLLDLDLPDLLHKANASAIAIRKRAEDAN